MSESNIAVYKPSLLPVITSKVQVKIYRLPSKVVIGSNMCFYSHDSVHIELYQLTRQGTVILFTVNIA
jgi:hypothetical protein